MERRNGYATLRMGLRPPRAAVVFDGGDQWHFWARVALFACTNVWGGEGFILVPHRDGSVHPDLLAAVRRYDPDYVLTLQRTLNLVEHASPGTVVIHEEGRVTEGERRLELLAIHGVEFTYRAEDESARAQLVRVCSPHLRRDHSTGEWQDDMQYLTANGATHRLTSSGDIPGVPNGTLLGAPPDWGGSLGVLVASRCGAIEEPRLGATPILENSTLRSLAYWLTHPTGNGVPPEELVRPVNPGFDASDIEPAFSRTTLGLIPVTRGIARERRVLVTVGDTANDFALAYAYQRMFGRGVWLPVTSEHSSGTEHLVAATRNVISEQIFSGNGITIFSTLQHDSDVTSTIASLHEPIGKLILENQTTKNQNAENIELNTIHWTREGITFLVVDNQFNQDYAVPVIYNEDDDIEMVTTCPAPAIHHPTLATQDGLHWQVEIELHEALIPHGRQLDGVSLLPEGADPYLTWLRSGRDGIVFESERWNFIAAGTPRISRLARPRLRIPGLATWADLLAKQTSRRMAFSAAGRRVEVMKRLWGDRTKLAADIAGDMLLVLRAFRSIAKRADLHIEDDEGVFLATGAGDALWEAYLNFPGMLRQIGVDQDDEEAVVRFRSEVDRLLEAEVLRRGLILDCAHCRKVAFIAIDIVAQQNRCPRCSAQNSLSRERWRRPHGEPRWFYDMNPIVREHLTQDGEIPLLLSHYLRNKSRSYTDVAELELLGNDNSRLAEVDLIALSDHELITAEAKRVGSLGQGRILRAAVTKRIMIADQLEADQIVLATTDQTWKPGTVSELCTRMTHRQGKFPQPAVRLISGLGSDNVQDLRLDVDTGKSIAWA